MVCSKCGQELPDDALFCGKCGQRQEQQPQPQPEPAAPAQERNEAPQAAPAEGLNQDYAQGQQPYGYGQQAYGQQPYGYGQQQWQAPVKQQKKLSATMKIIIIAVVVAVAAVAATAIIFLMHPASVDLNPYITVTYDGYDGYGTAYYTFDSEGFVEDYGNKLKLRSTYQGVYSSLNAEGSKNYTMADMLADSGMLYGWLDTSDGLSNGDEVVFTWGVDPEELNAMFKNAFTCSDITFTVEGLEQIATFDAFENVAVTFSGLDPEGEAAIEIASSDERLDDLYFELDQYYGLSNGDTVTVTISYGWYDEKDYAEAYGCLPESLTKTYTVDGLGSYVTSLSQISEEALTSMQTQAQDAIQADAARDFSAVESLTDATYVGAYFRTVKDGISASPENCVYLVYQITAGINNEERNVHESFTYYTYVAFEDLVVATDGTVTVDLGDYSMPYSSVTTPTYQYQDGDTMRNYGSFYYDGYGDLESMYNDCITYYVDRYTYESSVTE